MCQKRDPGSRVSRKWQSSQSSKSDWDPSISTTQGLLYLGIRPLHFVPEKHNILIYAHVFTLFPHSFTVSLSSRVWMAVSTGVHRLPFFFPLEGGQFMLLRKNVMNFF